MKRVTYFAQSSLLLFSLKKKQLVLKNVVNKRYIIKSVLKRKLIMMCFRGPLICYALVTPEALLVTQTLYFSQFFPRFFVGLHRICLCANVPNFEYRHVLIACKNWLCGYETWMKAIFPRMKNTLFCSQFSPRNTGNRILGLWNSEIFWGSMPPDPPWRRELTAPCWYSRLLYSTLLATSIIIETSVLCFKQRVK